MVAADGRAARTLLEEVKRGKPLTGRERQAIWWAARGDTARETAEHMHIAPETVRSYRQNTIAKLGARNYLHAVVLYLSKSR